MRILPAVFVLALTPALAPSAPAAPDKETAAVSPADKLRADLDKVISIRIDKQPLSTAVEMLRKQTGVSIVLDALTIQQQLGFSPDAPPSPVDVDLKNVKVRTALRTILAPYNLGFAPVGDAVIVSTDDVAMSRQMRQHVNVDLDKVEFAVALKQIARETGVNIVVDGRVSKEASAKVSMQMEDVPLETAVRLLAEMAGLKPVRVGNVLFVTGKANAAEMRNDPDMAPPNPSARQQELLQLQIANGVPGGAAPGVAVPPNIVPAVPPNAADAPSASDVKDLPK